MLTFTALDIHRIKPGYFEACRADIVLFLRTQHPYAIEGYDEDEQLMNVTTAMHLAIMHDFVTLGSLRFFTYLSFFFSPLFWRNGKVRSYLTEHDGGDTVLLGVLKEVSAQNWALIRSRRPEDAWARAKRHVDAGDLSMTADTRSMSDKA